MGRPKSYERAVVAKKAMELFWVHGFQGASTEMLCRHMEINRYSLFAEFGSKKELFDVALEVYENEVVSTNLAVVEQEGAGLFEIAALFQMFAGQVKPNESSPGCLICNTASELAPHDAASREVVESYVARLSQALESALKNSQGAGLVRTDIDCADEAHLLATVVVGSCTLARAGLPVAVLAGAAKAGEAHLKRLCVERPPS